METIQPAEILRMSALPNALAFALPLLAGVIGINPIRTASTGGARPAPPFVRCASRTPQPDREPPTPLGTPTVRAAPHGRPAR
jgi:hypothetical protein